MSPSSNPTVCAVCLVNGRQEMVARAIRCFREQTYERKRLLIVNSGPDPVLDAETDQMWEPCFVGIDRLTIGELRNHGNKYASHHYVLNADRPEIFVHWDSDDWSHPRRIEEQVALLQASGKECVGYRDMLFWRECAMCEGGRGNILPACPKCGLKYDPSRETPVGEAWLYTNTSPKYCIGTSLCYWRRVWEARPFPDAPKRPGESGEDTLWLREVDSYGAPSVVWNHPDGGPTVLPSYDTNDPPQPRMIASIHGGNTSTQYQDVVGMQSSPSWKRTPEWDAHCRSRMQL